MSDNFRLPTDQYFIRNENDFAGRNRNEDKSLNPKGVFCPTDNGDQELASTLCYVLLVVLDLLMILVVANRGASQRPLQAQSPWSPTGVKNRLLYAFLIEEDRAEEWVITKRKDDGHRSLYTIETASRNAGWIAQKDGDNPQIAVRPLIVGPSDPPFFPPNELWNIQPLVG
ncbi:hypothetical protein K439DRAFT_1614962 [Ramaria rubella]|nr:hypothetical protein K439DRAFT_1614962 [Ramaria rubella]